jgi:hypothetical protein
MGGELLSVEENVDSTVVDHGKADMGVKAKEKRQAMLKKQVLLKKLQAVRSGAGTDITASYDPIEAATEYFYEEGLNEEGIDLLIEEIGLDGFVEFVEGSAVDLNEERAARRASVRAKSYEKVKAEVDKSDAAKKKAKKGEYAPSYAKKETDVTDYGDDKPAAKKKPAAMKKAVARKKEVLTQPVKKVAPKPVTKKVVKAVAKAKVAQPAKKVSKKTLRDKITTAYKAGVKRHKKAVQPARVFAKGMKAGAKATVKFAGKAKKALVGEKLDYDPMDDPDFDPHEAEKKRGVSGKNNPKGGKKLEKIVKEAKVDTGSAEAKASARNVRNTPPGKDSKFDTSVFITRKPGESLDSARTRKRREAHAKKRGVKEDKAFDNVVAALRKKHGEAGVLTKDSPKPKATPQPKRKPEKDTRSAAQREVDAQYGRTPWNKKGSLGT